MHYKGALFLTLSAVFNVHTVAAVAHGEVSEFSGKQVRWQQLAEGVFTGVPEHKWDDGVHKRYNVEWDTNEILDLSGNDTPTNSPFTELEDLSLEARNLQDTCRAAGSCIKYGIGWTLLQGINAWIGFAEYAMNGTPYKDLMEFLNQPFIANAAGVAIAGTISGQINEATKKECSTEPPASSQADIIRAALTAVLKSNPDAGEVAVEVQGPSGTVSIKVRAGEPNTSPALECA